MLVASSEVGAWIKFPGSYHPKCHLAQPLMGRTESRVSFCLYPSQHFMLHMEIELHYWWEMNWLEDIQQTQASQA